MKKSALVLPLIVVIVWMGFAPREPLSSQAQENKPKPEAKKVKELMQLKLEHAQKLLGAITVNDLAKTEKHAEELIKVRKEAAFKVVKTEQYEMWSQSFDESAKKLIKAARDKNLEAAKLGYLEMTLSCFHCHTYVRDQAKISLESLAD